MIFNLQIYSFTYKINNLNFKLLIRNSKNCKLKFFNKISIYLNIDYKSLTTKN